MEIKEGHKFKKGEKDDIYTQAVDCLINNDAPGLREILDPYMEIDPEVYIEVWYIFGSKLRSAMKKLLEDV